MGIEQAPQDIRKLCFLREVRKGARRFEPVTDFFVLRAFRNVDRGDFAPPGTDAEVVYKMDAFVLKKAEDGEWLSSMSDPALMANMMQLLGLTGTQRVLEVGTGRGYGAALLGQAAGEVHTTEVHPDLIDAAQENLKKVGAENVTVHLALSDVLGYPQAGPYNGIIVTASTPKERIPELFGQLAEGGRLVVPVHRPEIGREELYLYVKSGNYQTEKFIHEVLFVPLQ